MTMQVATTRTGKVKIQVFGAYLWRIYCNLVRYTRNIANRAVYWPRCTDGPGSQVPANENAAVGANSA